MGVVLVAALLVLSFPVPSGNGAIDRLRYQRAQAVPAVAVAAPVVLATALAAYGVYVAGSSVGGYDANLDTFYQGMKSASDSYSASWAQYCAEKGSFDNALQSAVDGNGNIQLEVLADNGFFDSARSYSLVCVDNGSMVVGESSSAASADGAYVGQFGYKVQDLPPLPSNYSVGQYARELIGYEIEDYTSTSGEYYITVCYSTDYTSYRVDTSTGNITLSNITYTMVKKTASATTVNNYNNKYTLGMTCYPYDRTGSSGIQYAFVICPNSPLLNNASITAGEPIPLGIGAVSSAIVAGGAAVPTSTVQPFEPTAEALETGYSNADIVDAINTNTGTVEGISGTLDSILSGINPLAGILQAILTAVSPVAGILTGVQSIDGIMTGLQSTPFGWLTSWWNTLQGYWQTLLGVLGATPIGTLIGNVTTGISTLGTNLGSYLGGISTTLDSFWTGVGTWLGDTPIGQLVGSITTGIGGVIDALGGFKDAVLEWLGDTPIAALIRAILSAIDGLIAGDISLAGILEAIGSIPASLESVFADVMAGVIEGVGFPNMPNLTDFFKFPELKGEPGSVALPVDMANGFQHDLADRVPFCYMVRIQSALENMSGNFNGNTRSFGNRSFYYDLELPFVGVVRFDGEIFLGQSFGGLDIATTIRILVTATLCLGLLHRSYKVIERASGSI